MGKHHGYLTDHASQRALERLALAGQPVDRHVDQALRYAAINGHRDVAVRLYRHHTPVGDLDSPIHERTSNGEDLWAVIRRGNVETFMWRRREQPTDPGAFRVDQVYLSGWTDPRK